MGLAITAYEVAKPAILNALLGEANTTEISRACSLILAKGMCLYGAKVRSACISSATTTTLWAAQIAATFSSSSRVQTRPPGLWGWQNKNNLQPLIFSSKTSKSIWYCSSLSTKGQFTNSR